MFAGTVRAWLWVIDSLMAVRVPASVPVVVRDPELVVVTVAVRDTVPRTLGESVLVKVGDSRNGVAVPQTDHDAVAVRCNTVAEADTVEVTLHVRVLSPVRLPVASSVAVADGAVLVLDTLTVGGCVIVFPPVWVRDKEWVAVILTDAQDETDDVFRWETD